MKTIILNNAIITLAGTSFSCPYCDKQYNDTDDKYQKRINKNKSMSTIISCSCCNTFSVTCDYKGDLVSFK